MRDGDGLGRAGEKIVAGPYAGYIDTSEDVEDMAQEVFLALCKRQPGNPEAYIFNAAKNLVKNYYRNRKRQRRATTILASGDHEAAEGDKPGTPVSMEQLRNIIVSGQIRLSAKLREAVELRFIEGLSAEHAARRIGCSKAALHKRLHRAKKVLRQALRSRE